MFSGLNVYADQAVIYQSVKAEREWDESGSKVITLKDTESIPIYIIENETLFLNIQVTRPKWMLYTEIDHPTWDVNSVQLLLQDHQDLAKYLPDLSVPNGGILWISKY